MSIMVICGLLGLVVDIGWANWRKEACKTAAEAAAQAAVAAAKSGGAGNYNVTGTTNCPSAPGSSTPLNIGCQYAKENGFTNGTNNATVTYQAGTTAGSPASGVSTTYWVSYTVSENIWTTFSAVLGKSRTTVSSRATAAVIGGSTGTAAGCMYILDPSAPNAFQAGNNATVNSGCGIYVNSNASGQIAAMYATGSAHVSAPAISTRGSYKNDNGGIFTPTPTPGATFPGDPFSTLAAPPVDTTCQPGNFTNWQATPYTPAPGTYCTFQVGNGVNTVLSSGVYVINGGSFSVQGGSTLSATGGVLIYLTGGAYANIANGTTVTLSPQSTGTYQGVLFYQDRTVSNPTASTFAGGTNMNLSGSLYFPKSLININNGAHDSVMAFVANRVNFQGGSYTINAATSQSQTGIAAGTTPTISLIE
jgi:hypothetical protein